MIRLPRRKNLCHASAAAAELLERRCLLSASLTFHPAVNYSLSGAYPVHVASAELRGDGQPSDIITSNYNGSVSVLLGNGNGTFAPAETVSDGLANGPGGLAVGDLLKNDSDADIVVSDGGPTISILIGNGNGVFQPPEIINVGGNIASIAIAQLSGDGDADIITADYNGSISVLMGNGNGTFATPVNTELYSSQGADYVVAGNFGNGNVDLAVANSGYGTVSVLMGGGNGTFNPPNHYSVPTGILGMTIADVNGDGRADILTVTGSGEVTELLGAPGATFMPAQSFDIAGNAASIAAADLNGDGNVDLLIPYDNTYGSDLLIVPGNGDGTFASPIAYSVGSYPRSAAAADVFGDGDLDIFAANFSSTSVSVLTNTVNLPTLNFKTEPDGNVAGGTLATIVVDIDNSSGNVITTDNSQVTLGVATGTGTLSGTVTVQAIGGVATFNNVSLDTAGTYKLSATDSIDNSGKSSKFTITPGIAAELAFGAQPANVTAGSQFAAITAEVEDQFGNVVTNDDSSQVTLGVKTLPLGGSFTPITAQTQNGVATFNVSALDLAGGYKFKATETGLSPAKSSKFFVTPAAASQFVFIAQPTDIATGVDEGPITVAVEDAFGNIETADSSTLVTLGSKIVPTGVTFSPIAIDDVDGIATFNDVLFATSGGFKLKATGSGLTPGKSVKFFVT